MMRPIFISTCAICGIISAYFAQPYVHDDSDATVVIVTTLTVLAGFMIAIITVLGDPAFVPDGSWRTVAGEWGKIERKIIRHAWLFILYLLAIGFLFAGTIFRKACDGPILDFIKVWVDYGYVFLAVTSFLLSFSLPFSLMEIQRQRLTLEQERRRAQALHDAKIDPDAT